MLGRLVGEEINLKIVTTGDLWNIRIDPTQVDQILANLVVNARDAVQGNGTISIEMANAVIDETIGRHALIAEPGDYVMLAVRDTGSGMDAATMEHIFEPFKTLFMSGYTSDIIADRGLMDEGINFIHKPISREALVRKVREVLDG